MDTYTLTIIRELLKVNLTPRKASLVATLFLTDIKGLNIPISEVPHYFELANASHIYPLSRNESDISLGLANEVRRLYLSD